MHEGEIGKSRARALICWPVNQCSLEDLVNISWLIFTSVCFYFIFFIIKFVMISTVGKKNHKKKHKNKKGKKRIRHTMSTIQLLLSHATVRVDICSRDFHLSQVHGNAWIYEVASRLLVILIYGSLYSSQYFVDIKKWPTCFESYYCTLFMSVHVGKLIIIIKKKKRLAM